MKDRPIVVFITLVAGLIASICCIVRGVGLFSTLLTVFITLVVFLFVGMIANKFLSSVHQEMIEHEKEEAERIKREKEEAEQREFEEHQRRLAEEKDSEESAENAADAGGFEE